MRSEPNSAAENRSSSLTAESGLRLYGDMVRIRAFEERVRQMSRAGLVPGLVHLYSGQEAVAVGVAAALSRDDTIASHHRGHGHCLARGAAPTRLFAEILGRESGYGLGRGGSMHILDPGTRNLGTNGIVGGGVPLGGGISRPRRSGASGEPPGHGVMPFVVADLVKLALIVFIPALALWLPSTMIR